MAESAFKPNEVQAYVHDRAQDGLRGLAVYDGSSLDVRYARSDIEADVAERFDGIHDAILASQAALDGEDERWSGLGAERASVQIREHAAVLHLRPSEPAGDRRGMLVELDTRVAQSLVDFVASVRRVAFGDL